MAREAADDAPTFDYHPWPRPIPPEFLPFTRTAVLLVLVTLLLLTVLPSLSILHLLVSTLILVSVFRRTRRSRRPREDTTV
ncbi:MULTISPECIES: hypothetical protein [unclassified Arthrobacter]|uniref:hypothetical protein n=1 Tax=unclassified Arthrobacter TaxID=235627 RepID=UPI0006F99BEA|nr:hypothetical protein [Arthrobacter sp. Leaf234]KQO01933.1 hypothetical protein ASF21_10335 [Arthrobacter sp. Leaf234]